MILKNLKLIVTSFILLVGLFSLQAKATSECFENTSRAIFKFNMALDDAILEPIAKGFNKLPEPIKVSTNNFTSNIGTLLSIPNNILQGNINQLGHSMGSFIVNTSVGVLGIFNPAEKLGLNSHKEDVGQTLGTYGIGTGCYFVLPILGPTTVRDSIGLLADSFIDPFAHVTLREKELFSISGNELDYYGGFSGAVPLLEDYFSWDAGFLYYDYPGMTDENTANGERNVDFFEYYASVGLAVPNPVTDIGISYYFGYSPSGFQADEYDYHNVGMEIAVPNTPFTISGAAGFTGNEMEGGNAYTDYIASISTSAFGVDLGISFTTIDGYGGVNEDIESDQIIFSIGKSF